MLLVNCRECNALLSSRTDTCPDCGALRPAQRFDAEASAGRGALVTARNVVQFRVLTSKALAVTSLLAAVAIAAWLLTRPSQAELAAQEAQATAERTAALRDALRSDLMQVMVVQESFYSDSGRYAALDELKARGFAASAEVTVDVEVVGDGYTATSTAADRSIGGCTVRVGAGVPEEEVGMTACDRREGA